MTKLSLILDAILFVSFATGSALAITKLKKAKKINLNRWLNERIKNKRNTYFLPKEKR